ncbi:MAG: hypothetical protein QOF73_5198 [Thermomicrobiales bacterium]|nr:hypothetical protein [Thermomicrobiales bacterium]
MQCGADAGEVAGDVADEDAAEPLVDGEGGEAGDEVAGAGELVVGEGADGDGGLGGVVVEELEGFGAVAGGVGCGVGGVGLGEGVPGDGVAGSAGCDGGEGAELVGVRDGDVVGEGGDGALLVGAGGVPLVVGEALDDGDEILVGVLEAAGELFGAVGHGRLLGDGRDGKTERQRDGMTEWRNGGE